MPSRLSKVMVMQNNLKANSNYESDLLVVIVNFNGGNHLISCIESILQQGMRLSITVVDNGSTDGSNDIASNAFPKIKLINSKINYGYGEAINIAAKSSVAKYLLVLNPDIRFKENCLKKMMIQLYQFPGIVGPSLYTDATAEHSFGMTINHAGMPTVAIDGTSPLFVQGCAMLMNIESFNIVNGFDGRYFLFVEDLEICWRALLAGKNVSIAQDAEAIHVGGGSIIGGYPKFGEQYTTTSARVSLRERNTIAAFISCAPLWWLPFILFIILARCCFISLGALLINKPQISREIFSGIWWNILNLNGSISRRRSFPKTRAGRIEAKNRFIYGLLFIKTLKTFGIPNIE